MRITPLLGAFASLTSAAIIPRQSATQIAKLGGWVETMTVRPNGNLLLNRLDVPELWTVDPSTKAASKVLSFPNALGLTGIAELSPDVYAVVAGNFSTTNFALGSGSYTVYKVDLTGSTPKSTLIKNVPESGFFIGVAPFNNDTIFIADAGKGSLYTMTLSTGAYSVALSDAKMKAPSSAMIQEGIHGLKYHANTSTLYFTNTFGNTFNKIAINPATGKPDGGVTAIDVSPALQGPEDVVVAGDGTAYVAALTAGAVFRIGADGKAVKVANATQASTVGFGRGASDKNTLYISTSQGDVLSAVLS